MDLNLKGRVAVAAGGANGAGREIALALVGEGAAVMARSFVDHRWDSPRKLGFAPDSPLEGDGFEPSVPPTDPLRFSRQSRMTV